METRKNRLFRGGFTVRSFEREGIRMANAVERGSEVRLVRRRTLEIRHFPQWRAIRGCRRRFMPAEYERCEGLHRQQGHHVESRRCPALPEFPACDFVSAHDRFSSALHCFQLRALRSPPQTTQVLPFLIANWKITDKWRVKNPFEA